MVNKHFFWWIGLVVVVLSLSFSISRLKAADFRSSDEKGHDYS